MQSTPFVSSTGEGRNPFYEGQFDNETTEQAEHRLHWSRATRESERANAHQIEVDRDIKAANLQLLVDKVLEWEVRDSSFQLAPEVEPHFADLIELARSLKQ